MHMLQGHPDVLDTICKRIIYVHIYQYGAEQPLQECKYLCICQFYCAVQHERICVLGPTNIYIDGNFCVQNVSIIESAIIIRNMQLCTLRNKSCRIKSFSTYPIDACILIIFNTSTCVHAYICTSIHAWIHMCKYVCMHLCISWCVHEHTHIPS